MFTGIIRNIGKIKFINNYSIAVEIFHNKKIEIGDSIACNGACLTVVKIDVNLLYFDLAEETIKITNLSLLKADDLINIEFAARFGDKIDGHIINGHVYGTGEIVDIIENNNGWIFSFYAPDNIFKYIDLKASIAVNGISLTISNLNIEKQIFEINIIPHTFKETNLHISKIGDRVNIEPDIFAIYAIGIMSRMKK